MIILISDYQIHKKIADNGYKDIVTCQGHLVIDPKSIIQYEFDEVIITLDDSKKESQCLL